MKNQANINSITQLQNPNSSNLIKFFTSIASYDGLAMFLYKISTNFKF